MKALGNLMGQLPKRHFCYYLLYDATSQGHVRCSIPRNTIHLFNLVVHILLLLCVAVCVCVCVYAYVCVCA